MNGFAVAALVLLFFAASAVPRNPIRASRSASSSATPRAAATI